ncbi:MAG: TIM barrel protein [Eubacteriales bacterium]|nr:TIM barrel protein [Eubacteriales bacterium]
MVKYGIMSIDFKRLPLEHCYRLARDYGFSGLEIFCTRKHVHLPSFTKEDAAYVRSLGEKYQIEVPMLTPNTLGREINICSVDARERSEGIQTYKTAVDAAEMLNVPMILLTADHPGYFVDKNAVWDHLLQSVTEITDYAAQKGIKIVIEPLTPMESPVVTTAADCRRLIDDVRSPALYAMLDIVPPVVVHESISQYFELLEDRLAYIHICNTDGVTDAHFRLDRGVLPIYDVLNTIKHHHYEGYITAELYSENYRDPELFLSNTARVLAEFENMRTL